MSTWAITCYFNTSGFRQRYANYRLFSQALDVPLVTVEWSVDGNFELAGNDADILVQVSGGDLLWQKERLLNLGLEHLPADCTNVVWLDCDILFNNKHWVTDFETALSNASLVQLFSHVSHGKPASGGGGANLEGHAEELMVRESLALRFQSGGKQSLLDTLPSAAMQPLDRRAPADPLGLERSERSRLAGRPSAGHGWGMRRELLEALKLYDCMIFGTGDMAIALAGMGLHLQYAQGYPLGRSHRAHYVAWADRFFGRVQGRVAAIPGTVNHLYHGNLSDRQYGERLQVMRGHGFDPHCDVALAPQGVWQWQGDAGARFRGYMQSYFTNRAEDSPDRLAGL